MGRRTWDWGLGTEDLGLRTEDGGLDKKKSRRLLPPAFHKKLKETSKNQTKESSYGA